MHHSQMHVAFDERLTGSRLWVRTSFCPGKDLCLEIYLQVLHDTSNLIFLKPNTAFSPQTYSFSGLPTSGQGTNTLQWSRLGSWESSPPSPDSPITLCPISDSGVCLSLPHCHSPGEALHRTKASSCSPHFPFSFPSPLVTPLPWRTPRHTLKGASALPHTLPEFVLPRGLGLQWSL